MARATDLCSFAVGEAEGGLVQLGVVDTSSATATPHLHPESENMYSLVLSLALRIRKHVQPRGGTTSQGPPAGKRGSHPAR